MTQFFDILAQKPDQYELGSKGITIKGNDYTKTIPSQKVQKLISKCTRLNSFEGYNKLLEGFKNPEQFDATEFEIDCAIFCLDRYRIKNLRFGIEVEVGGHIKHPDFEIQTNTDLTILVECKSLHSINRFRTANAVRILNFAKREISDIIPDQWRVEISFSSLPHHWNRNLGDQIKGATEVLIKNAYTSKSVSVKFETGKKINIKLCKRDEPHFFKGPVHACFPSSIDKLKILVTEACSFTKAITRNLGDALTQLPQEYNHMIFIYPLNHTDCLEASKRFFESKRRPNLLAIHSQTDCINRIWNPYCRLSSESLPIVSCDGERSNV